MSLIDRRFDALFAAARNQELVILVWGPGDPGPGADPQVALYWAKRNQIKDHLKTRFPKAEVHFSESPALRDRTRQLSDTLIEELAHAEIADCILILDVARGASLELDHFSADPSIAQKIRLLIPKKYVGGTGLVSSVHNKVRVSGFADDELTSCRVATEIAPNLVDAVAIAKIQAARLRGFV
jgi:hypothetical protein